MTTTTSSNETLWLAIAEPSRRRLIDILLGKGEATASQLADDVPFSRQAVSKHMAVLKNAGLISARRTGKEVRFAIQPDGISAAAKEMSQAAKLWDERLEKIKLIAEAISEREQYE